MTNHDIAMLARECWTPPTFDELGRPKKAGYVWTDVEVIEFARRLLAAKSITAPDEEH